MSISGTSSSTVGPELLVEIDRGSPEPLHRQLADGLRTAIRTGRLAPQSRLPSSRVLAADLGVSRRMVVDAYSQLVAEGFLVGHQGAGTRVATIDTAVAATRDQAATAPASRVEVDFAPGTPDLGSLPRQAWLRALRQGLLTAESEVFGYVEPQGLLCARVAVADYLRRTRGVVADPDRVVICSGVTQAVSLLAHGLRDSHRVAMEDPGFWLHRLVLRHHGIEPVPVPVDEDGLDVAALTECGATAVLTTPAHQSPTGVVLSAPRRAALLEWGREGNLIIEDDYDAEFRYDRAPVGALQGLAPDLVVYTGSASKTLAPGIRIGWMVLPPQLVATVTMAKAMTDVGTSAMDQLAFTHLLTSGVYDRHLRQMRRRYVVRRNTLLQGLARLLPEVTVLGAAAGLHLTARFPDGFAIHELVRRAAAAGVRVEPTAPCYADRAAAPPGMVLGYANLTESQIVTGVQRLAEADERLREEHVTDERLREEHVTDERLREEHVTDERLREEHVTVG